MSPTQCSSKSTSASVTGMGSAVFRQAFADVCRGKLALISAEVAPVSVRLGGRPAVRAGKAQADDGLCCFAFT
jgi:hypothetical protein